MSFLYALVVLCVVAPAMTAPLPAQDLADEEAFQIAWNVKTVTVDLALPAQTQVSQVVPFILALPGNAPSSPTSPKAPIAKANVGAGPFIISAQAPRPVQTPTTATPPLAPASTQTVTVTQTNTIVIIPPPSSTTLSPTANVPPPAPADSKSPVKPTWKSPATYTNLSCFGIQKQDPGASNLLVVPDLPPNAFDSKIPAGSAASPPPSPGSSVMQVLYPEGSVNPAQEPIGGTQFYATPLDLKKAANVTLQYSVFFPADFDWVRGGKLPGIYGGHMGCSGGNDAKKCFSTRLMWRTDGAGELYLYAPKDKQTYDVCHTPPKSYCNDDYGLSIGRGSFRFAAGNWTTVRQTVTLNTPGIQDGTFTLDVNGVRAINLTGVLYRENLDPSKPPSRPSPPSQPQEGGFLDGLLGDDDEGTSGDGDDDLVDELLGALQGVPTIPSAAPTAVPPPLIIGGSSFVSTEGQEAQEAQEAQGGSHETSIGFSGLFFSTFFGGHDEEWASPRDQYVWFKDFMMVRNA